MLYHTKRERERESARALTFALFLRCLRCEDQIVMQYYNLHSFVSQNCSTLLSLGSSLQQRCYFLIWFLLFTCWMFFKCTFLVNKQLLCCIDSTTQGAKIWLAMLQNYFNTYFILCFKLLPLYCD